jgi:hypothetical protein
VHCRAGLGVGDRFRSRLEEHRRIVILFHDLPPVEQEAGRRRKPACAARVCSSSVTERSSDSAMRVPRDEKAMRTASLQAGSSSNRAADRLSPVADTIREVLHVMCMRSGDA